MATDSYPNLIAAIAQTIDLTAGVTRVKLPEVFVRGDSTQSIDITVQAGGVGADLSGVVAVFWFIRGDGTSFFLPGTIAGSIVSTTVESGCTSTVGRLYIQLQLTVAPGSAQTVLQMETYVLAGATDVVQDPSGTIPSVAELLVKIGDCEDATDAANTAADNAQDAADAITDITAESGVVTDSDEATAYAETDPVDDHINLVFGIPRARRTWSGTAITGTSATPTPYTTGITYAMTGDRYRYNGITDAQIGNEYVCTAPGNEATALWVYDGNTRGAAGSVTKVDGVSPDITGNVPLGALPKAGGTMTGLLELMREGDAHLYLKPGRPAGTVLGLIRTIPAGSTTMQACDDETQANKRYLEIATATSRPSLDEAAFVGSVVDGVSTRHRLYHAGMATPIPIPKGGTGATTAADALAALGAMPIAGGTYTGQVTAMGGSLWLNNAGQYFNEGAMTAASGTALAVYSNGKVVKASSSRRYKDDIRYLDGIDSEASPAKSEAIYQMRPVSYEYKDQMGVRQVGLIAEDLEAIDPALCVYNARGEVESVKYQDVGILLLREVQKLRAQVTSMGERIAQLENNFGGGAAL